MEAGVTKRDIGRARRGHTKPDQQVEPDQPTRKRRRPAKDGYENTTKHKRKSPRIQENFNKERQKFLRRATSQPSRKSLRLQEIRDLNRQGTARGGRQTRSSSIPTETQQHLGEKQPKAGSGNLRTPRKAKQRSDPKDKIEGQAKTSGKRRRSTNWDEPNHDAKRPGHSLTRQTESRMRPDKEDFIEKWLNESCWSRRTSTENEASIREQSDNMSRKPTGVLPSPGNSFDSTISTSRKSEASAASVRDSDYRESLRYRNIYINRNDPPVELMRRAERIISRPRASPEMDGPTAQKLRNISRRVENEAEEVIVQQLAPKIIPAMNMLPDQRLALNADQLWSNSVPIPLDLDVLTNPLPLPRPKPDLAFGYSEVAFNHKQLMTIDLLIDDQFGRSYVVPDQKLRFPFLNIEFKSQAENGTHYVATNQVAGAGAIALNGNMELIQRSFGVGGFDFDEPQFFSVTMDHELARINVHWVSAPTDGGQYSFHVEGLSKHLLDDANGLRAVTRAIKNIFDHRADARLRTLFKALDAYREKVLLEREAMSSERDQRFKAKPQPKQRRGSRGDRQSSYEQQQ